MKEPPYKVYSQLGVYSCTLTTKTVYKILPKELANVWLRNKRIDSVIPEFEFDGNKLSEEGLTFKNNSAQFIPYEGKEYNVINIGGDPKSGIDSIICYKYPEEIFVRALSDKLSHRYFGSSCVFYAQYGHNVMKLKKAIVGEKVISYGGLEHDKVRTWFVISQDNIKSTKVLKNGGFTSILSNNDFEVVTGEFITYSFLKTKNINGTRK